MQHWYFAYGSNLDSERLEGRVGRKRVKWQLAELEGYSLSFDKPAGDGSGYAMISVYQAGNVYGVVYALNEEELRKLDSYEGVPNDYGRTTLNVRSNKGDIMSECYLPVKQVKGLLPRRDYLNRIIAP